MACHTATMKTGNTHPFAELRNQTIHPYRTCCCTTWARTWPTRCAEANAAPNLWRTAPLWGLGSLRFVQGGDRTCAYLHDGRARSMLEAILWHGGEADSSRTQFEALPKADRDAVVAFLQSP